MILIPTNTIATRNRHTAIVGESQTREVLEEHNGGHTTRNSVSEAGASPCGDLHVDISRVRPQDEQSADSYRTHAEWGINGGCVNFEISSRALIESVQLDGVEMWEKILRRINSGIDRRSQDVHGKVCVQCECWVHT